jgi:hypothetical protein
LSYFTQAETAGREVKMKMSILEKFPRGQRENGDKAAANKVIVVSNVKVNGKVCIFLDNHESSSLEYAEEELERLVLGR